MAKQLVNPIERHVEKGVLAIAGLVLIAVIARYLVTSPNQLKLGADSVGAPLVNQKIAQKATAVRENIKRAQAVVDTPEPVYDEFVAQLDPFKAAKIPLHAPTGASIGPEVPLIDPAVSATRHKDLPKILPPEQPVARVGRSTLIVKDAGGASRYVPANWVTVTALVNVKAQMVEMEGQYGLAGKAPVFGFPELQRRARRPNGSWAEEDWVTLPPWPVASSPALAVPSITLVEEGDTVKLMETEQEGLRRFQDLLLDLKKQRDIIRPKLPDTANGTKWEIPVITSKLDVLKQDDYYLNPTSPPSSSPADIYSPTEERGAPQPSPDKKPKTGSRSEEIERAIKAARDSLNVNDATRAYNEALTLEKDKEATESDRAKGKRLREMADEAIDYIRRKQREGLGTKPEPPGPRHGEEKQREREPLPVQQVWVHDAEPGSVQSGRTYQYRLRPVLYNRMAGQPEKFKDPLNGQVVWMPGPWTEPVEVTVEPSTLFYVTLEKPQAGVVRVDFFQWFDGVWVKAAGDFGVGQELGLEARCDVPSLDNPNVASRTLVDFKADAKVVDIDYSRSYRERKRGSGRTGVKFGPAGTGCSVVFVDAAGDLQERFVPTDKGHPDKAAAAGRVWSARK